MNAMAKASEGGTGIDVRHPVSDQETWERP
jgi:hypothetical protein